MQTLALRQVSVLLDEQAAPAQGAFAHALEWASRLALPLRALLFPASTPATVEQCARACAERGVLWDASVWRGAFTRGVEDFLRPAELCVFGDALPLPLKGELLRRALDSGSTSLLVCPGSWSPASRVLILNQHREPWHCFLDHAFTLCRTLALTPVILTVARSERAARRGQQSAEERAARQGLHADFDFVVGWDVPTAVSRVARWRRCTHVFAERPPAASWWSYLRGDPTARLLGLSGALTLLLLPGAADPFPVRAETSSASGPRAESGTSTLRFAR
jgi:hypothetical protein